MELFSLLLILASHLSYPFPPEEEVVAHFQDKIEVNHLFSKEKAVSLEKYCATNKSQQRIEQKAVNLEERLQKKVLGQEPAVKETAAAIVRYAAGVNDPNMPIATLLFSGPSGVGKTELAKQLCLELYGSLSPFVRINMSEFSEAHTISRLIGSPPGYVGYVEGGQLTNALLENPFSIVLLDEIEKAHPQVLKLFLHVFDEGVFTSAAGHTVNCRNAVFISTSNILASEISTLNQEGLSNDEIAEILRPYFITKLSPELFNRLNFIVFSPLSERVIRQLVERLLVDLQSRVEARRIFLSFDESLVQYLMKQGVDPELGARPLKRLIDRELATVLAQAILDGNFHEEDIVKCSYHEGKVIFKFLTRFDED